jgi:hypothetical protein
MLSVTPRSSVTGSNLLRPGALSTVLGSPPARCSMTSVERFRPLTLLTPATGSLTFSKKTRNLKFLYGSSRDPGRIPCGGMRYLLKM